MNLDSLTALSPLDGRYAGRCNDLRPIFSESGLIRARLDVEIAWLRFLAAEPAIDGLDPLTPQVTAVLDEIAEQDDGSVARAIKEIEATTNHDVKAVEYFLSEAIASVKGGDSARPYIHFGCTSEDINNLSYALLLSRARDDVMLPGFAALRSALVDRVHGDADAAMMSRTHGQSATPTTMGKEVANVVARLDSQIARWKGVAIKGKFNGATGNYNAHLAAYPDIDWAALCERFVRSLGLDWQAYTTQIEPHDWTGEYCDALAGLNTVFLDTCRDFWGYISLGYFRQRPVAGEVGSSTMPHKINPIDFENAEGNLGVANALLGHFSAKLPISRWQRDLSDSTVQRNIGVAVAYSLLAWLSFGKGLSRLESDRQRMAADLEGAWELLAEPIQTVMRRHGHADAYEQLKALTRGATIDKAAITAFIARLDIPDDARQQLLCLTPASYTGAAEALARQFE